MDENGNDQSQGVLNAPKKMSSESCLNWCNQRKLPTGCEYKIGDKTCQAHTWSVSSASGANHKGSLCSIILPKG